LPPSLLPHMLYSNKLRFSDISIVKYLQLETFCIKHLLNIQKKTNIYFVH
jgi:hypothetical protein